MRRGHALKALLMVFAMGAIACAVWSVWDCADPLVELERDSPKAPPLMFKKAMPKGAWKGKIPGAIPLKKKLPPPDGQQSPQIETRPRLPLAPTSALRISELLLP